MDAWRLTPEEWSAVWLSVLVALTATVGSLPLGVLLGHLLARRKFFGKSVLETFLSLPLVLPPVVTGYFLLVIFGSNGWLGGRLKAWFGIQFAFNWKGAALASAIMGFPLMVRAIRVAIAGVNVQLEQAARTLGAGPVETFVRITLPLARRGIIAGAVLAFARSLGEFGATIVIAGNLPGETRTIPLYIFTLIYSLDGMDSCWRLLVVSVLLAATALAAAEWLERGALLRGPRHGETP
jgi:molybdate transport system permease protein